MYKRKRSIFLILITLPLLLFVYSCKMPTKERKRIVLIHSFEEGRENYAVFNEELIKELDKQQINADIHTFYLNCERYLDKDERERMYNYIDSIQDIKPDIILVNDDQATYSLLGCEHPLIKKIPIVFAGVNYPNWNLIKQHPNVTGWYDKQDFVKNIEFIHALFGQLTVRIAYDRTVLGKQSFVDVMKQIKPHKEIVIIRSKLNSERNKGYSEKDQEAIQILTDSTKDGSDFTIPLKPDQLAWVQFTSFRLLPGVSILTNLSGMETQSTYLDIKYDYTSESMSALVHYPSFSAHNEPIQYSPGSKSRYIGGYMTSIEIQAREQAQSAARILTGTAVSQITVKESTKEHIILWRTAKAWGMTIDEIPAYARIIGMPFKDHHKTAITWFTWIAFATIIVIASLLGKMYIREEKYKKKAQHDLIKQNKILEVALEKAKESDQMKSAFLANMSHEIRTPLNAIVGFSNLLNTDIDLEKEERTQFLELINTNSDLLLKLINDILDLSRIESGRMAFSFDNYDLSELVHNIYSTYQMMMPSGVKLLIDIPKNPVTIYTDKHRLMQVITNFLNNAIKFTCEGYIKVGYSSNPESRLVHIFVEDTGKGIAKEKQAAVFERFTKLDEFAKGTGLGLSICKVITERFSGKITVSSEEGTGSHFTVILPLKPENIVTDIETV
ncbi:sensor histidine kinase [Parabacteroides sp. BX2]|jgi:signal transduction histidine kinase|uniref:histidine kinase n=2 Tax=Tannerellaceae TaxID=2005525 RepID=A0ABR7DW32_9BACT|nr:sensor histidine kinase [Parabacteroides segnis]